MQVNSAVVAGGEGEVCNGTAGKIEFCRFRDNKIRCCGTQVIIT